MSIRFTALSILSCITAATTFWPGSSAFAESTMRAPDDWHYTKIEIENYTSPEEISGFTPTLNIVSDSLTIDQELAVLRKRLKSISVPFTVDQPVDCTGQRAQSVVYTSTQPSGVYTFRQLILQESTGTKVITYTKPAGTNDDPSAIAAMQSVCGE